MNIEQLYYVLEIERTCSINQAAKNLFVSQSALSVALSNLEKELGEKIFSRTPKGVEVTPFGKTFIKYIYPIQIQLKQIDHMFLRGNKKYSIAFSMANDGFRFATELCAELYEEYKAVGIRIVQYDQDGDEARSLVANGVAEVGIIRVWSCYKKLEFKQFEARAIEYHPLIETDLSILIGPKNPLFSSKQDNICVDKLADYPMIKYGYLDSGPFTDILDRLNMPSGGNELVATSRATAFEMLDYTDGFIMGAGLKEFYNDDTWYSNIRSMRLLTDSGIRSMIGWIQRSNADLSMLATRYTRLLERRFGIN